MDHPIITPGSEDAKRDSWDKRASQLSLESNETTDNKSKYQLQVISKKEPKSKRPLIESTKFERLSFYNTYTTSAWKSEFFSKEVWNYNSFIWLHIGNYIFKSLSHTFLHMFLASYAPEEHIFLTKMVPFCVGHKFLVIAASLAALYTSMNSVHLTFFYFINGLLYKNPWNRCRNSTYYDARYNIFIHCYELEEFTQQFVNITMAHRRLYVNSNKEHFSLAQYEYLRHILKGEYPNITILYLLVATQCILIGLLTIFVSKKVYWKILHFAHWSNNLINVCAILYILFKKIENKEKRKFLPPNFSESDYKYLLSDINIVEGITTAPAHTHVLTSRSIQPIHPSGDSTVIVISIATYYLFRIYLTTKMTSFCKNVVGVPLDNFPNEYIFFIVWPVFFSQFYFGDLYSFVFLGLNAVAALLCCSITFRCLVEMVIYEWTTRMQIKPWMVIIGVSLCVILIMECKEQDIVFVMCTYAVGCATLCEIIILYIFYPLGRLIDDYTFHYGVSPTKLRKLSLQIVPFYYVLKFMGLLYGLHEIGKDIKFQLLQCVWCWTIMLAPLILGIIFTIYKQFKRKARLNHLFRPDPSWGPKQFAVRQLRKLYDSRVYIKSDVTRSLGRYLLSQAEPKAYKLDVLYDLNKRYHIEPMEVRFKFEKKKKYK